MDRLAALVLAIVLPALPTAVAAQALSCRVPQSVAPAAPAEPDGPPRSLPITSYTLAVTWAPDFCRTHFSDPSAAFECGGQTARFGFVLHGLWPDSDNGSWPQWCPAKPPATREVPAAVVRQMLCTTPSPTLLAHEWGKHGTCMAPTPAIYFNRAAAMYRALRFPDMNALALRSNLTAGAFRKAFAAINPRYPRESIGLQINQGGALEEIHLCHDTAFRPRACDVRGAPDTASVRIAPLRR